TCTSKIERKMLSFVTLPARSIFTILPSAGETIIRGSDGISRAGFRKKNPTNPESNSNKTTATYKPKTAARLAEISNGTIKLNASLIIMIRVKESAESSGEIRGQTGEFPILQFKNRE